MLKLHIKQVGCRGLTSTMCGNFGIFFLFNFAFLETGDITMKRKKIFLLEGWVIQISYGNFNFFSFMSIQQCLKMQCEIPTL